MILLVQVTAALWDFLAAAGINSCWWRFSRCPIPMQGRGISQYRKHWNILLVAKVGMYAGWGGLYGSIGDKGGRLCESVVVTLSPSLCRHVWCRHCFHMLGSCPLRHKTTCDHSWTHPKNLSQSSHIGVHNFWSWIHCRFRLLMLSGQSLFQIDTRLMLPSQEFLLLLWWLAVLLWKLFAIALAVSEYTTITNWLSDNEFPRFISYYWQRKWPKVAS